MDRAHEMEPEKIRPPSVVKYPIADSWPELAGRAILLAPLSYLLSLLARPLDEQGRLTCCAQAGVALQGEQARERSKLDSRPLSSAPREANLRVGDCANALCKSTETRNIALIYQFPARAILLLDDKGKARGSSRFIDEVIS